MKTIGSFLRSLNLTHCLLASLALAPPTTAFGQGVIHNSGYISFNNTESTVQGVTSHLVRNLDGALLVGTQYKAELYYMDTTTGTLTPIPAAMSSFKATTTSSPGTWATISSPVAMPAGYGGVDVFDDGSGETGTYYPVTLAVRAWDSTTGNSWESASVRGESPLFIYTQRARLISQDIQMITQPGFQFGSATAAPGITTQPQGQTGYWGKSVSFTVVAYGTRPLTYQWLKDGSEISGATQSTLTLTNLDVSAGGDYSVVITNSFGSITSSPAFLLLNAAGISMGLYAGLTINGVVGNTYGIQYITNLTHASSWITVTNLTLTDPVQLWVDTTDAVGGTAPRRIYRVVAVP